MLLVHDDTQAALKADEFARLLTLLDISVRERERKGGSREGGRRERKRWREGEGGKEGGREEGGREGEERDLKKTHEDINGIKPILQDTEG
jgi:hypothetical protein